MEVAVKNLNVGIAHDWLPLIGGAEKVIQQLSNVFQNNELYTLFDFLTEEERATINTKKIHVSRLNKLPRVKSYYRNLLLLCTREIDNIDVSKHDVVISSSAALAKGVRTGVDQPHICYMHSPARYAWDLSHQYLAEMTGFFAPIKREIAKELMYGFRQWDMRSTNGVDALIANSHFIKRRIEKVYRRQSEVIYPPVNINEFSHYSGPREEYYITASRLVPYKKIDLIVKAFSKNKSRKLLVIGDGPELQNIKKLAAPNVEFLGYQNLPEMISYIQRAKAFVFAAYEDFGILPVEAQACGTPVICLGKGGTAETVNSLQYSKRPTGVWFMRQEVDDILGAVDKFEKNIDKFSDEACRKNAESFGNQRFCKEIELFVANYVSRC